MKFLNDKNWIYYWKLKVTTTIQQLVNEYYYTISNVSIIHPFNFGSSSFVKRLSIYPFLTAIQVFSYNKKAYNLILSFNALSKTVMLGLYFPSKVSNKILFPAENCGDKVISIEAYASSLICKS